MNTIQPIYNLPGIHALWAHRWKRYFHREILLPNHHVHYSFKHHVVSPMGATFDFEIKITGNQIGSWARNNGTAQLVTF